MLHRSDRVLVWMPMALAIALMFALAPACTMPACSSMMGLAGMIEHGQGCQDYMMVDDTPDGLTAPQAPAVAVTAVAAVPLEGTAPALVEVHAEWPSSPEYDPLGVRIRV
ncbi:MAG: hypothetical protein RQ731_05440 [Anaerosomatales bacterium]|nr:hypothetical protein [Anaerosomatales bacterium]MDT8434180.1 hypothetical protein [Anaerosomatales bacterium]